MSEPFTAERIVYFRPNRLLRASPLAIVAAPLIFLAALAGRAPALGGVAPLVFMAGVLGTTSVFLANRWPGRVTGKLVAGPDGVFFDGRRLASRAAIRAGLVVPQGFGAPMVRLTRTLGPPLDLGVKDDTEGRALLTALGLDASQTVATFRTPSRLLTESAYRIAFVLAVVFVSLISGFLRRAAVHGGTPSASLMPLLILGGLVAFSAISRARIDVGADGVLTSWLGMQKRFLSYRQITSVATYVDDSGSSRSRYRGVVVTTTAGEEVRMPVVQASALDSTTRVHAVLERIREAMTTYQRGEPTAGTALLDRGERDVTAWIRALRTVGSGAAADHRTAPVLPDQLWRIVEDPSQSPELRAGAAVVLGGSLDDDGRARLRVAASAVAEPRVRVAIEAASGADEEALAEALADLPRDPRGRTSEVTKPS